MQKEKNTYTTAHTAKHNFRLVFHPHSNIFSITYDNKVAYVLFVWIACPDDQINGNLTASITAGPDPVGYWWSLTKADLLDMLRNSIKIGINMQYRSVRLSENDLTDLKVNNEAWNEDAKAELTNAVIYFVHNNTK